MINHHTNPLRVILVFLSVLIIVTPTIIYFLFSPSYGPGLTRCWSQSFWGAARNMGRVKDGQRLLSTSSTAATSSKKKTIAIIGAGVSGLQAARTILQSPEAEKFDVVIFEARDRIGGRAWTNHPWKFPLDYGIPPSDPPPLIYSSTND